MSILKASLYLRIFPTYGQIIRLSYKVMFEAMAFSVFFYSVITLFASGYYILGNKTGGHPDSGHGDGDEYGRLRMNLGIFFYSYRTAIGDLEVPNTSDWDQIEPDKSKREFIIHFIWFIWMMQQYFMLIVLLNFLIAIIS